MEWTYELPLVFDDVERNFALCTAHPQNLSPPNDQKHPVIRSVCKEAIDKAMTSGEMNDTVIVYRTPTFVLDTLTHWYGGFRAGTSPSTIVSKHEYVNDIDIVMAFRERNLAYQLMDMQPPAVPTELEVQYNHCLKYYKAYLHMVQKQEGSPQERKSMFDQSTSRAFFRYMPGFAPYTGINRFYDPLPQEGRIFMEGIWLQSIAAHQKRQAEEEKQREEQKQREAAEEKKRQATRRNRRKKRR